MTFVASKIATKEETEIYLYVQFIVYKL
jgi:hypothetical protein